VRLFDAAGTLAALGQPDGVTGAIRPSVVLL
jgi:hypothetical protein